MAVQTTDSVVPAEYCPFTQSKYFETLGAEQGWFNSPGVDKPYPVNGGLLREEAIMLLRRFYVQENNKGAVSYPHYEDETVMITISPRTEAKERPPT